MGDTANCEMASTAAGSHPIHPVLPAMSSLLVPRGKDVHTISCPGMAVSHAARGIASKENPSAKAATQCGDKCHHRLAPLVQCWLKCTNMLTWWPPVTRGWEFEFGVAWCFMMFGHSFPTLGRFGLLFLGGGIWISVHCTCDKHHTSRWKPCSSSKSLLASEAEHPGATQENIQQSFEQRSKTFWLFILLIAS